MHFNVQLNYEIYNKNAVFLFLCGNTIGTSFGRPEGLPLVAKEVGGVYPKGTLRESASIQISHLKKYI